MTLLNYKTYGKREDEALLIIHGLFGCLDNWMSLAKLWSSLYYVIAVDVRNHGKSFHSDDMRFESITDDILNVLSAENIDKVNIIGHSMGGKIAMDFASRYPERLLSLIIVDVAPFPYQPHHNDVFEMLDQIDLKLFSNRGEIENEIRKHLNSESVIQFIAKNIRRNEESMQFEWKFNYPVLKREYTYLIQRLPERGFEGQVLFIGGERSDYITKESSERIPDLYPNYDLEYVKNAGHWVHAENPSEFYKIVVKHLLR